MAKKLAGGQLHAGDSDEANHRDTQLSDRVPEGGADVLDENIQHKVHNINAADVGALLSDQSRGHIEGTGELVCTMMVMELGVPEETARQLVLDHPEIIAAGRVGRELRVAAQTLARKYIPTEQQEVQS